MGVRRRFLGWLSARPRLGIWLNLLPGLACLLIFVFVPLVLMAFVTFWRSSVDGMEAVWNLDNYRKIASDPIFSWLVLKSVRIAVTVTVTILLLGYPLAYIIARKTSRYPAPPAAPRLHSVLDQLRHPDLRVVSDSREGGGHQLRPGRARALGPAR